MPPWPIPPCWCGIPCCWRTARTENATVHLPPRADPPQAPPRNRADAQAPARAVGRVAASVAAIHSDPVAIRRHPAAPAAPPAVAVAVALRGEATRHAPPAPNRSAPAIPVPIPSPGPTEATERPASPSAEIPARPAGVSVRRNAPARRDATRIHAEIKGVALQPQPIAACRPERPIPVATCISPTPSTKSSTPASSTKEPGPTDRAGRRPGPGAGGGTPAGPPLSSFFRDGAGGWRWPPAGMW